MHTTIMQQWQCLVRNAISKKRQQFFSTASAFTKKTQDEFKSTTEFHSSPEKSKSAVLVSTLNNNSLQEYNINLGGKISLSDIFVRRIVAYIEEVSHMNEVRVAQEKVIDIKDRLEEFGDTKREILRQLEDVRQHLQRIFNDIKYNESKTSERYLHLVKEEVAFYRKEKQLHMDFKHADEQERLLFNAFSAAINDSYEKEKRHSNFIKLWGIIGTLIASSVTLIASIIGHYHHQSKFSALAFDFRQDIHKVIDEEISKKLDTIEKKIHSGFANFQNEERGSTFINNNNKAELESNESWYAFLKRNTRWIYGWAIPKY